MVSLLAALLPYHCTECCNSDEAKPPIVEGYGDLPGIVQVEEPGLKDDLLAEAPLTATVVTEDSKPEVEGQTLSDQLSESGSDVVIEGHDDGSIVSDRSDISCSDVVIDGELSDTSPVSSPSKRNRRGAERKKKERSEPKGMILGAGDEEDGTVISGALGINIDNPGKIADFYDLGRSIGEGSFGAVFKATVRATDAVRAVKRIPLPKSGRDRELRLDFLKQEIRITKMMDHPSIVKLFEVFEDDKSVYMVMELCRDGDLEEHIQEGGLDELDAATVMQQILRGVAYMHNHRICHRDLKSENMLLVMRPVPKASKHPHSKFESAIRISDFGLSCTYADGQMLKRNCGTDSHKSPQVFAHNYNYKCDVWACGVIMYFLLSGSLPFEGRDAEEMQKKITNAKVTWCQEWMSRSGEAMNLARQLLHSNEGSRIEASQALKHKWFSKRVPRRRLAAVDEEILNSLRGFRKLNKFRKASLAVIASMLPEKVIRPGRDLFIYLDKDGDGE
ncbi:CPK2, partial [Symbiodinium pilosum]